MFVEVCGDFFVEVVVFWCFMDDYVVIGFVY